MGCDVDDPAELLAAAELALDRARRFGDVNLETKALADAGLAHVQAGRVTEGMTMLDEAMALACGPADDNDTAAKSVCSFFTACYYAADFERAGSWADLLRRHGLISLAPGGPVFLSSHCDSVQATMLLELGRWTEAEAVLTRARSDFRAAMQMPSWHPDIALADLRIRQGRLAEAEALLVGKDHSMQALLPAARLHLARGDHELVTRSPNVVCVPSATTACAPSSSLLSSSTPSWPEVTSRRQPRRPATSPLAGRPRPSRAESPLGCRPRPVVAATGALVEAIAALEATVDQVDPSKLPWLRATLQLELARLRERAGDVAVATIDAKAAAALLATLDVVLAPADVAVLERLTSVRPAGRSAALARVGKWWIASCGGSSVRLQDSKGFRYLGELLAQPGVERHVLDLVDRVEGVATGDGPDRRALGDAGSVLDARARTAYRHRIEELRVEADEALAAGLLDTAEARQAELDHLVAQLARAFGLGGRDRRAASAAERARLNVTRALRAAITRLADALPQAGAALDRRVRTGVYCAYEPAEGDEVRWIVQS